MNASSRSHFALATLLAPFVLSPVRAAPVKAKTSVAPQTWQYALEDDDLERGWAWRTQLNVTGDFVARVAMYLPESGDASAPHLVLQIEGDAGKMRLSFWRVTNGKAEKWGEPGVTLTSTKGELGLQGNGNHVRALWNGRAVLSAWSDLKGSKIGFATRGRVTAEDTKFQPTEPVLLRDDFMTAQGPDATEAQSNWQRISGVWRTSGMMAPKVEQAVNPNPFVFRAEGKTFKGELFNAVATTNLRKNWFWSDYTVAASVKPVLRDPNAPLVAALSAFNVEGQTGIVGGDDFRSGRAFLRDGSKLLVQSAPFPIAANQWHSLYLDPGPGVCRLLVNGVERARFELSEAAPARGGAALQAKVSGANYVDFDDVKIGPNAALSDSFRSKAVGRWDDARGTWATRAEAVNGRRVKVSQGVALTLTGDGEREEGRVEASFNQIGAAAPLQPVGVAFAVRDEKNFFLARVRPVKKAPVLEIVEYRNGVGRVLAAKNDFSVRGSIWPTIVVEWRDGLITASAYNAQVNGELTATVPQIPSGRVGAWADGPSRSVALTSFRALGAAPNWGEPQIGDRIAKDYLMKEWASNATAWTPDASGMSWHTGDFFRDAAVDLPLPAMQGDSRLQISLRADPTKPDTGATLKLTREDKNVRFVLSEEGRELKNITVPVPPANVPLRFARLPLGKSAALRVALNGKVLLSETVSVDAKQVGARVGVRAQSLPVAWEDVKASTSSFLDYTFTSAPVDWNASAGLWEVAERWTCTPVWGFMRGGEDTAPALWSRFATRGDYTLEAYVATPMDMTRGERSPIDLNVTVDGDGRDFASGYSFLFGAKGRSINRVYRGDAPVWEKGFELPPIKDSTHRDWFYVRLERRMTDKGLRFRYLVNNQVVADYTDADPLWDAGESGGGRIAFWTYNGDLSIARVRVWHDGVGSAGDDNALKALAPAPAKSPLKNALSSFSTRQDGPLSRSAVLVSAPQAGPEKRAAVKITNPRSGGDWTTFVTREAFDANNRPLSWSYRVPQGVQVNLYALVDGRWREVMFTGDPAMKNVMPPRLRRPRRNRPANAQAVISAPPVSFDRSVTIGKVEGVQADGKWHTATLDLAALLKAAGLGTRVEALAFAAPDRDYLRAGLGGNHLGATYYLADFKAGAPKTVAALPK